MIKFIKSLFHKKLAKPVFAKKPLSPEIPDSELDRICKKAYDFILYTDKNIAKNLNAWVSIPPVKVTTTFGGWGFVAGQSNAFLIDHDIHMFEFDSCMDFTDVVVLIKQIPCLILSAKRGILRVSIINDQDYLEELFNPSQMFLHNKEDLLKFSKPVQNILLKILGRIYQSEHKPDPIEVMLDYSLGK